MNEEDKVVVEGEEAGTEEAGTEEVASEEVAATEAEVEA